MRARKFKEDIDRDAHLYLLEQMQVNQNPWVFTSNPKITSINSYKPYNIKEIKRFTRLIGK